MSNEEQLRRIRQDARSRNVPIMQDDGMKCLLYYIEDHPEISSILELGTAVGLSAIEMASIRDGITVDTVELDEAAASAAIRNIREAGLSERICVHVCDAAEFETQKQYDLVFVDAAKAQYRTYLERYYPNTHAGSVFVFDNLNFHGMVDTPSLTNNKGTKHMVRKIKAFRSWLLTERRFQTVFYSAIGDGIAFARRKR